MARKPKIPEHVNHERWLVSYADFITLLFAFFTVLYATAQTDSGKVKKFVGAAERAFSAGIFSAGSNELMLLSNGDASGREIIDLGMNLKDIETRMAMEIKKITGEKGPGTGGGEAALKLERHAEGLSLQLQTKHFFTPGSDVLRPEALAILPGVVEILKRSSHQLRVEGHTDDVPIHNALFRSNWELSSARALAVLRFLLNSGLAPQRLSVAGHAQYQPLLPNTTPQGRARNRRVEIVILDKKPSFWAHLKKKPDEIPTSSWRPLITNDQLAPRPPASSPPPNDDEGENPHAAS